MALEKLLASVHDTNMHRKIARVYASYGITDTRNTKESRDLLDAFRTRMWSLENCAVFDPLTMDELPITKLEPQDGKVTYNGADPKHRWPLFSQGTLLGPDDDVSYPIVLPAGEVEPFKSVVEREGEVSSHVRERDLRLIDQVHLICAWRPTFPTGTLSSGVLTEVNHAKNTGKLRIQYIMKGVDKVPENPLFPGRGGVFDIHDELDDRLWRSLATIHNKAHAKLDSFLE